MRAPLAGTRAAAPVSPSAGWDPSLKKIDSRTVSNRIAHHFWMDANKAGFSEAEFFRHTGIAQAELRDPGGRVNTDKHRRMLTFMASFPASRAIVDDMADL